MVFYGILMLAVSVALLVAGILIFKGKIDLIHSYHRESVTDLTAYGKAMGKALAALAIVLAASGIIALVMRTDTGVHIANAVMLAGFAVFVVIFLRIQGKYNGG